MEDPLLLKQFDVGNAIGEVELAKKSMEVLRESLNKWIKCLKEDFKEEPRKDSTKKLSKAQEHRQAF